jgi:hypothetical protein
MDWLHAFIWIISFNILFGFVVACLEGEPPQ